MPKFKKNTSAFMMKGYTYPGTSPMKDGKIKHELNPEPKEVEGKSVPQETTTPPKFKADMVRKKNKVNVKNIQNYRHTPVSNNNKGTLKGVTGFEYNFPKLSKFVNLTNPVSTTKRKIKDISTIGKHVTRTGKKVKDYFTKR